MQNREIVSVKKETFFDVKKIAISGAVISIYVVIMMLTQSFAFGQYQVRVATSLYALAAIHPFLIFPLGAANLLSNTIMGGLGPLDMIGGFAVGLMTAAGCYYIKKISVYLVALPIWIIPTLIVPIWLSQILGISYLVLVVSVGIGQILPGILGVLIVKYLEKPLLKI